MKQNQPQRQRFPMLSLKRHIPLFLCLFFLVGCAHGLDRGRDAVVAEDHSRAESIAETELRRDRSSPWGNLLMAESLFSRGEPRQALPYARRANQSDIYPLETALLLTEIYEALNQPVDAADSAHAARQIDAGSLSDNRYESLLTQAITFVSVRRDHVQEYRLRSRLQELSPSHPEATPRLVAATRRSAAAALRTQGEFLDAIELLERSLAGPSEVLTREALDLGELYARMEMPEDAQEAWEVYMDAQASSDELLQRYRDVVEMATRYQLHEAAIDGLTRLISNADLIEASQARLQLALSHFRQGATDEGRVQIEEYLQMAGQDREEGQFLSAPYLAAFEITSQANQTRLGIQILERGAQEALPSRALTRALADLYARRAQMDEVERTLNRFIDRYENRIEALDFAGSWAKERNNFELARHYLSQAADHPDARSQIFFSLAEISMELGEDLEVTQAINAFLRAENRSEAALARSAQFYVQHRYFEDAERLLKSLVQGAPQNFSHVQRLANLYTQWARPAEVAATYEEWIRRRGNQAADMAQVGQILTQQGDLERAGRLLRQAGEAGQHSAFLLAADIYLRQDHQAAMIAALEAYLQANPNSTQALSDVASRYQRAGLQGRQTEVLFRLIELQPENWRHHETLASLLFDQGRSQEALSVFERYVENSSDQIGALEVISRRVSQYPASMLIDFFQRYADRGEQDARIYRLLGDSYYALASEFSGPEGALDEARRYYLLFLEHAKELRVDWHNQAVEWRTRQIWGPAAGAYRRYIEAGGAPLIYSFGFAETLLRLGEPDEAETNLEVYFRQHNRRPDAALRVARLLQTFQRFDAASEYARYAFVSGNDDATTEAFVILAEILRQQEDHEALDRLINEFPERTTNRARARRLLVTILESHGRYEQAARQLEGFQDSVVDQAAFQLGVNRFRLGDSSGAMEAFESAATRSPTPGQTWLEAALFLQSRGDRRNTATAFDRAVQISPDQLDLRTFRGLFFIEHGMIDEAMAEFEFGLRNGPRFPATLRAGFFNAFLETGQYQQARQVAQSLDLSARETPASMATTLGSWDLRSQDRQTSRQAQELLHNRSWGVHAVIDQLIRAGRHREGHELILDEFREGDPATAAALLITHAPSVARLSGWDLHQGLLGAVADPLQRSDSRLVGAVGDHRARRGQLDEARIFLQAAVDHDDRDYRPQLGSTLLMKGERDEAFRHFEAWLLENPTPEGLEGILLRFEIAGDYAGALRFLDRILEEPALIAISLPQWTHYSLENHGDPERAIANISEILDAKRQLSARAFRSPTPTSQPSGRHQLNLNVGEQLGKDDLLTIALVRSLETIAALGYTEAVDQRITQGDLLSPSQDHRLHGLRMKLALARQDQSEAIERARELVASADGTQRRQEVRVALARQFIAFGVDEPARVMVNEALEDQVNFRSHQPFLLHLGLLILEGKKDSLDAEIDAYIARVPNRLETRRTLIDELARFGLDEQVLRLANQAASRNPTANAHRQALIAALNYGHRTKALEHARGILRTSEDPIDTLDSILSPRLTNTEPFFLLPLVEEIRKLRPASVDWRIRHISLLFRDGQMEEARKLLLDTFEQGGKDREIATFLTDFLRQERRDVEIARVLAKEVSPEALWPQLLIHFAEAEFGIGFLDEGMQYLAQLSDYTDDEVLWKTTLADTLINRGLYDALRAVVATINTDISSPHLTFLRAISELSHPDSERATSGFALLQESNTQGMRVLQTHQTALTAALNGGHFDLAREVMKELTDLSFRDNEFVHFPLHIILRASMDHPRGPETVLQFLEDYRPRLVDGHGATWTRFAGLLAGAFERTGDPEGAFGFYRDRIWLSRYSRDNDRSLPVYLNNLAYTYSTTNQNIDDGMDMIWRAILLAGERNASYIDTLGWLLYRQGDLDGAEREVRRALRSYDGPPHGRRELLLHLEEIMIQRSIFDQAAWLHSEIHRLPTSEIEW